MKRISKAYIYALLSVFLWSTVATAFKLGLMVLSPLYLILLASTFSLLIFFVVVLIQGKTRELFTVTLSGLGKICFARSLKSVWLLPYPFSSLQPFTGTGGTTAQYDLANHLGVAFGSITETKNHHPEYCGYSHQFCWSNFHFVAGKSVRNGQYQHNRSNAGRWKQRNLVALLDSECTRQTRRNLQIVLEFCLWINVPYHCSFCVYRFSLS